MNQIAVQSMLERDGHHVVLVANGADAVAAVMQMPILDGRAATHTAQ